MHKTASDIKSSAQKYQILFIKSEPVLDSSVDVKKRKNSYLAKKYFYHCNIIVD